LTDFAAAPTQPIAQGVIFIDASNNPQFFGKGVAGIFRGAFPGTFLLVLGAVANPQNASAVGTIGLDPNFARSLVTVRGKATGLPSTTIDQKSVDYPSLPGGPAISVVRVVLIAAGVGVDPSGVNGNGCEVIVWNGNATPDNYSAKLVGPLFNPPQ
jgi:hypothetical protein